VFACEARHQHLEQHHHQGIGGWQPGIAALGDAKAGFEVDREHYPNHRRAQLHQRKGTHQVHKELVLQGLQVAAYLGLQALSGFIERGGVGLVDEQQHEQPIHCQRKGSAVQPVGVGARQHETAQGWS